MLIGLVRLGAQRTSARDLTDPGPGVVTMRRTLKRDIPLLLAQRRKGKKSMVFV